MPGNRELLLDPQELHLRGMSVHSKSPRRADPAQSYSQIADHFPSRMFRPVSLLLVPVLFVGCVKPGEIRSADMSHSINTSETWTVIYRDHSGNGCRFWRDGEEARFAYDPVTPETSSSGAYSGGRPANGLLEPAQVASLFEWVRALEADTENHAATRRKGTGSFVVNEGDGAARRFIVRGGRRLEAFDGFVEAFRGR